MIEISEPAGDAFTKGLKAGVRTVDESFPCDFVVGEGGFGGGDDILAWKEGRRRTANFEVDGLEHGQIGRE